MSRIYEEIDPGYAATCSDGTVYSNKKGFFKGLAESLTENTSWLEDLEKVEDGKKIQAVKENKEIMDVLEEFFSRIQPIYRQKDRRVSEDRRHLAEDALKAGDLEKALLLATQAVLRAPTSADEEVIGLGGTTLALALWLRSEILLQSNKPKAALEDLRLALKNHLPVNMRAKYYWRMGHCYKGTGEPSRAKVSYELALRLLAKDEEAKKQLTQDINTLDFSTQAESPPEKPLLTVTGGAKQNMPALSKLVKITEDHDKGRFAVANSQIRTGDILLIDNPYAACLHSDHYGSHCLHCFKSLQDYDGAPVWCPKCSAVAFCSAKCQEAALSSYHKYECEFLDLFTGSGMSILSHMALRIITQTDLETNLSIYSKHISNVVKTVEGAVLNDIEGVTKKSKMRNRKERLNRSKKGLKSFSEKNKEDDAECKAEDKLNFEEKLELKAAQFYSLCAHSEQRKGEDYLKRIVIAMFLTECLKKSGFFKKCDKENLEKAAMSICELIVRNLQILQFNAHEIYETLRGEHMFSGSKPVYIAVGVYPTGALFNHECYPAVARYFEGSKIILRATRPLSAGEVVSENYGPHFLMRNLKERQRSLSSRYWFKCECTACREDWPTLKQMKGSDTTVQIRCLNNACHATFNPSPQLLPRRCPKCSTDIDNEIVSINMEQVIKCIDKYREGAEFMSAEQTEDAISVMCDAVDMFHEVAVPPHRPTHFAQEALRSCYAASGNVQIVPSVIIKEEKSESNLEQ